MSQAGCQENPVAVVSCQKNQFLISGKRFFKWAGLRARLSSLSAGNVSLPALALMRR